MRHPLTRLGPVLWVLCACLLMLPRIAEAGDPSLAIDFDGDGRHDSVRLDQRRPSVLRIWLSASGTTQVLVSRRPFNHVAATDLDGDHRPELIASDGQAHIQVWTPKHTGNGFRRFHRRQAIPKHLSPAGSRRVDGRNREPEESFTGGIFGPPELTRATRLPLSDAASVASAPRDESTSTASPAAEPFSPRPPPAHATLRLSVAGVR